MFTIYAMDMEEQYTEQEWFALDVEVYEQRTDGDEDTLVINV